MTFLRIPNMPTLYNLPSTWVQSQTSHKKLVIFVSVNHSLQYSCLFFARILDVLFPSQKPRPVTEKKKWIKHIQTQAKDSLRYKSNKNEWQGRFNDSPFPANKSYHAHFDLFLANVPILYSLDTLTPFWRPSKKRAPTIKNLLTYEMQHKK